MPASVQDCPLSVEISTVKPSLCVTVLIDAQKVTCGEARVVKLNGPMTSALFSLLAYVLAPVAKQLVPE